MHPEARCLHWKVQVDLQLLGQAKMPLERCLSPAHHIMKMSSSAACCAIKSDLGSPPEEAAMPWAHGAPVCAKQSCFQQVGLVTMCLTHLC